MHLHQCTDCSTLHYETELVETPHPVYEWIPLTPCCEVTATEVAVCVECEAAPMVEGYDYCLAHLEEE